MSAMMHDRSSQGLRAAGVSALALLTTMGAARADGDSYLDELRQSIERQQQQMEQQNRDLQRMRDRLERLEEPPAASVQAPVAAETGDAGAALVTSGDFPGSIKIPGTGASVKVGGYAKLDVIHDFDDVGAEDLFVTSSIPVDGDRDGRTRLHGRQSRLNVDLRAPSEYGPVRVFVEGDFFGGGGNQNVSNSSSFRLRHAYGELGNLTAGQAWTTFMDVAALPETIDFEGPNGSLFIRQALLRWTQPLGEGLSLAVALENPEGDIANDGDLNLDQYPDGVVRGLWEQDWGHLQAGLLAREIRIDTGTDEESEFGWGATLSGKIKLPYLHGKDNLTFQANYGDGIGRYIVDLGGGGFDAAFDAASGNLETLDAFGGYVGYQHWWSDALRSTAVGGYVNVDPAGFQTGDTFDSSEYVAANLIWSPIERIDLGVEYLYGRRENRNGDSGDANRLQFGALFRF